MSRNGTTMGAGGSVGGDSVGSGSTRTRESDRGGPADRAALRKTIKEKAFYDDNSTLLPNPVKMKNSSKPSRALTEALEFRRRFNEERRQNMESQQLANAEFSESIKPENVLKRASKQHDDADEEELVGAFMKGEIWIRNPSKEQRDDRTREAKLYHESAKVLAESRELQVDFHEHHIGTVDIPPETDSQANAREQQEEYIDRINGRMELFDNYKHYSDEVLRLNMNIFNQERETLALEEELREGIQTHDFEWQKELNHRIIKVKAKTDVDHEDLEFSQRRLTSLRDEIARKFPEMSSNVAGLENTADANAMEEEATTEAIERDATNAFAEGSIPVYCWLLGRLTFDNKICCMLFGQFSKEVTPPKDNWIYIGKNVDRNLVATNSGSSDASVGTTTTSMIKSADGTYVSTADDVDDEENEMMGKLTSIAEKDHVLNDFDMLLAKSDTIRVIKKTNIDGSYAANVTKTKPEQSTYYSVENCSLGHLNGKYLDAGKACNVPKYRNNRGWALYRCSLMEIPDLGIFADSCYEATASNTGVAEALNRRAGYAMADIVNRHNLEAPDGSVQFKRRFAEIARSGQRVINQDQTDQLIRNENIKADVRNESDRAMMMILSAVMGKGPQAEDDEHDSNDEAQAVAPSGKGKTTANAGLEETKTALSPILEDKEAALSQRTSRAGSLTGSIAGSLEGSDADEDDADAFGESSQDFDTDDASGSILAHSIASGISRDDEGDLDSTSSSRAAEEGKSGPNHQTQTPTGFGMKKKVLRKKKNKRNQTASGSNSKANLEEQAAAATSAALNKIASGVDLDIKVTLSKGTQYQVGSQGYPLSKKANYTMQEAQLYAQVTKYIEAREAELFKLQIESNKCHQSYLEAGDRIQDLDIDGMMADLFGQMRVVRESTLKVAETYGAWARLCHLAKKKPKPRVVDQVPAKSSRTFCVNIAFRGPQIYPQSREMVSTVSSKFGRSIEKAKYATDIKYVGEYSTREEALEAFHKAMSEIDPNKILPEDMSGAKALIGLRACRKHYLTRSSNVPQDIPCEACQAASMARPSLVAPAPFQDDEREVLQQFIWHGKDYLEKIWEDTKFLNENFLLKNLFPEIVVEYNPLILPLDEYNAVLESTNGVKGDGLTYLRGKVEQVLDAQKAGTFKRKHYHGYELKALPYSNTWTGDVELEKSKLALEKSLEARKESFFRGEIEDENVIREVTVAMNAVLEAENRLEIQMGRKPKHTKINNLTGIFTPWSELSPRKGIQEATLGRTFPPATLPASVTLRSSFSKVFGDSFSQSVPESPFGITAMSDIDHNDIPVDGIQASTKGSVVHFAETGSATNTTGGAGEQFVNTASGSTPSFPADTLAPASGLSSKYTVQQWLSEDPLDFVSKNRLNRAFYILGQSTTLTKKKLPEKALPAEMKKSILDSKGLLRSAPIADVAGTVGADGVNITKTKGSIQGLQVEQGDDHLKTVDTEVSYYYRGAQFAMPQMRVPNQGRIEDVWVNYDAPEWQGIAKGRNIRSFEFNERVLREGAEKNEYRKRLQALIRAAIAVDVVLTDVPKIKRLIEKANKVGGSVLKLDCIQAESFMKWRSACVKSIRKMQAMARGNFGRKKAKRRKAEVLRLKRRVAMIRAQSIILSREVVPKYIKDGMQNANKHLNSIRFTYSLNMSGEFTVVRITLAPRRSRRDGNSLCPACTVKASHRGARNSVKVSNRAPLEFIQNGNIVYQAPEGIHTERGMCTCRWVQLPEQWQLSVFEPLTQYTRYRQLSMHEVRSFIESIVQSQSLMDVEYRLKSLIGKSFAPIAPLFVPTGIAFDGRLDMSYTMARLKAAEESSILPLLPKYPGIWMTSDLLQALRQRKNLPIDRLKPSSYTFSRGMDVQNDFVPNMELAKAEPWLFEPLSDILFGQRHAERVKRHEEILKEQIKECKRDLHRAKTKYEAFVVGQLEAYPMRYEDARSRFIRTDENLEKATARIDSVMQYSKANIESLDLEEKNIAEDWRQDYDALEDGSAWEGLNQRRKLLIIWEEAKQEYHKYYHLCPSLLPTQAALRSEVHHCTAKLQKAIENEILYKPTLQIVQGIQEEVLQLSKKTMKTAISTLSMPRKLRSPIKRRMQHVKRELVFIRDPIIRAQPKYLGCWSLLERSNISMRVNDGMPFTGKSVLRCVVEVFKDPLTQWILIRLLQDELPTEESVQHADMGIAREQLSDLTSAGLETDILLRPSDVDEILAKPPNWPAVHIKKTTRFYKNNSLVLLARNLDVEIQKKEDLEKLEREKREAEEAREREEQEKLENERRPKKKGQGGTRSARGSIRTPGTPSSRKSMRKNSNTATTDVSPTRRASERTPSRNSIRKNTTDGTEHATATDTDTDTDESSGKISPIKTRRVSSRQTVRQQSSSRPSSRQTKLQTHLASSNTQPSANVISAAAATAGQYLKSPAPNVPSPVHSNLEDTGAVTMADLLNADVGSVDDDASLGDYSSIATNEVSDMEPQVQTGVDGDEAKNELALSLVLQRLNNHDGFSLDGTSSGARDSLLSINSGVSSYTPRKIDVDLTDFILPSKRVRSLDGVKVYPNSFSNQNELGRTYSARKKEKEERERKMAENLMTYLRLHPYTGRPCLGLVHMQRKTLYAGKILVRSQWYRDLARGKPSMWVNEVTSERRFCGTRLVLSRLRACLDHFEAQLELPNGYALSLLIPFKDVVSNLIRNKPSFVGSFLCETILNEYSQDTHNHIINYIDFQLPGFGSGLGEKLRFWRKEFLGEVPRLRFLQSEHELFRGPISKNHRFIAGKYFEIVFSLSASSDLRIELKSPTDGHFAGHKYWGDPIVADLPKDVLRSLVAKLCLLKDTCPKEYQGNLDYLHPNHWINFFPVLLDLITIDVAEAMRLTKRREIPENETGFSETSLSNDRLVNEAIGTLKAPNYKVTRKTPLDTMIKQTKYLVDKFNLWTRRTNDMVVPISSEQQSDIKVNMRKYFEPSPWKLNLRRDDAKGSLVEIRNEVWSTLECNRYVTDTNMQQIMKDRHAQMATVHGAKAGTLLKDVRDRFEASDFIQGESIGQDLDSHWDIHFLSNEQKEVFFVDLQVADINHEGVQREFARKELENMALEDTESRIAALFSTRETARFLLLQELHAAKEVLSNDLAPAFAFAQEMFASRLQAMRNAQLLLLRSAHTWLEMRAQNNHENALMSLTLRMSKDDAAAKKAAKKDNKHADLSMYQEHLVLSNSQYCQNWVEKRKRFPLHPKTKPLAPSPTVLEKYPCADAAAAADVKVNERNAMDCKRVNVRLSSKKGTPTYVTSVIDKFTAIVESIRLANVDQNLPDMNLLEKKQAKSNLNIVASSRTSRALLRRNPTNKPTAPAERYAYYSTATLPRYAKYAGTLTNQSKTRITYRDPNCWQRVFRPPSATHKSRNIAKIGSHSLLVSDVQIGPADIAGFSLYDPSNGRGWSVCLASHNIEYPWLGECIDEEANRIDHLKGENSIRDVSSANLIKTVTGRFVWSTMVAAVSNVVVEKTIELLEADRGRLEKKVVKAVKKVDSITTKLEHLQNEIEHDERRLYNRQFCIAAGLPVATWEFGDDYDEIVNQKSAYSRQVIDHNNSKLLKMAIKSGSAFAGKIPSTNSLGNFNFAENVLPQSNSNPDGRTKTQIVTRGANIASTAIGLEGGRRIRKGVNLPVFRHIENAPNIKLHGVMIPHDEALPGVPFCVSNKDWNLILTHFYPASKKLKQSVTVDSPAWQKIGLSEPLKRTYTLSSFVYTPENAERHPPNPRLTRWIEDYSANKGFPRSNGEKSYLFRMALVERSLFARPEGDNTVDTMRGNAILLLRFEKDVEVVKNWLKERYDEYAPMRELRRQKEGREKEFRIANHLKFRDAVFAMASKFLTGFEKLFKISKSIAPNDSNPDEVSVFQCRVLLSRFLELKTDAEKEFESVPLEEQVESYTIMDESFLIDTEVAHSSDEQLLRFDTLPDENIFEDRQFVLDWKTNRIGTYGVVLEGKRHDLHPRAGQLIYAVYQLHCSKCTVPTNLCPFPGCGIIRTAAAAVTQEALKEEYEENEIDEPVPIPSIDEFAGFLDELKTTGRHPLERAIRRYMLEGRHIDNTHLPVYCSPISGVDPKQEIADEEKADLEEILRLENDAYLKIRWQAIKEEARYLRYINRRHVKAPIKDCIHYDDVLSSHGGINNSADEDPLDRENTLNAIAHIPETINVEEVVEEDMYTQAQATAKVIAATTDKGQIIGKVARKERHLTGEIAQIPKRKLLEMLGCCGIDAKGGRVPVWAIDPYPAQQKDPEEVQDPKVPMAAIMFRWLAQKMVLSRPDRSVTVASGDRGQLSENAIVLKLDRLHCETSVTLLDGSIVVLQCMQGYLSGAALNTDEISGTPPAAIRFCPVHLIGRLEKGITVVLFDLTSGRTRAVALEGRALFRVAETFHLPEDNTPAIANSILENAASIIRINRVGIDCTGFVVDMNGITDAHLQEKGKVAEKSEDELEIEREREGIILRYHGRKSAVRTGVQTRRLILAKRFLAQKNIQNAAANDSNRLNRVGDSQLRII
eukprot:GSChrysophyteH1.ASY1.ANO1.2057.1 assembled CDS